MKKTVKSKARRVSIRESTSKPMSEGPMRSRTKKEKRFEQMLEEGVLKSDPKKINEAISEGADIDMRLFNGRTALLLATMKGNRELIELLLEKGASPRAQDDYGFDSMRVASSIVTGGSEETRRQYIEIHNLLSKYALF